MPKPVMLTDQSTQTAKTDTKKDKKEKEVGGSYSYKKLKNETDSPEKKST